ncbi:MAG: cytochrome c3 family protein [Desulfatiglandales bacterium]
MKKNLVAGFILIVSALVFLTAGMPTAADVAEIIVINNQGYDQDRRGPVNFSHKKHAEDYKVACDECHHEFENGKNVWKEGDPVKQCIECHDPIEKKGNAEKLQTAFHDNCHGCHRELKDKEAPFKKCTDCHERKS